MLLHELNVGETAVIDMIKIDGALKDRLSSLGVIESEPISVEHYGWFRSTVQIKTASSFIALRKEEATCIEVSKIA